MEFSQSTWVAIAFVTFFILVGKKGFSVLINILDKRKELVENEIEEAKKLKEQAQDELNASLKKQKVIINEIEDILAEAKEAARKIKIDAEIKAAEIVKRKEEQAKQKINASETEIINQIKEIASKVVILSSEEYIKENINKNISKDIFSKTTKEINSKI
tara:strand:+ start:396 stop:875 length:480 start_codon:yes stop_codon:yes gene_type:complete